MFAKATRNFLKEVDAGGDLISVSHLNDSDKLQLLSLVTKKKRYWCWQRPKYQFLSATLGDVLTEGHCLSPVVVESDFVKYESKCENHKSGTIGTVMGKVKLNVGGKGLVESQSSFGTLRKQEVDVQQLIQDAVGRTVNLDSLVLQQVLESRNEVLCVLTQKIVTTQKCVISEHVQSEETCGGMVGIQTKIVQVSAMEDGTITTDTNVMLEIPAATTIAYGIMELYVKKDGQFEMPDNATVFLGTCCKLHVIPSLCHLLHALSDDSVCDFQDPTLAPLRDTERFGIVQRLFASADIALERMQFSAKATILKDSCMFPLILHITLSGLYTLSKEHEEHLCQSEVHATSQD